MIYASFTPFLCNIEYYRSNKVNGIDNVAVYKLAAISPLVLRKYSPL
jgi:hypothetical protein